MNEIRKPRRGGIIKIRHPRHFQHSKSFQSFGFFYFAGAIKLQTYFSIHFYRKLNVRVFQDFGITLKLKNASVPFGTFIGEVKFRFPIVETMGYGQISLREIFGISMMINRILETHFQQIVNPIP